MTQALGYGREQTPMMAALLFVLVLETAAVEVLLRAVGAPGMVRAVVLALDVSSAASVLVVIVACARRPHLVTPDRLCLRYGPFFRLEVPMELVASARVDRRYDEKGIARLADGELRLAVSAQTNVVVDLVEPVEVRRPRGRAGRLRFFADDPAAALRALRPHDHRSPA